MFASMNKAALVNTSASIELCKLQRWAPERFSKRGSAAMVGDRGGGVGGGDIWSCLVICLRIIIFKL